MAIPSALWHLLLLFSTSCSSWNLHVDHKSHRNSQQRRPQFLEEGTIRRRAFLGSIVAAQICFPRSVTAYTDEASKNGIITVRLGSPKDSLGVEIYDTIVRDQTVVAIRRIVVPNQNNRFLQEGMILRSKNGGSYTSKEFAEKLRYGPYPLQVDFFNLAAGGDALSDLGTSIVTPRDALDLVQKTDTTSSSSSSSNNVGYTITTTQQTPKKCVIQSRRNDVLEINYEASYVEATGRKVVYDASAFRGTGNRPYQMVLGSGDMIPGVDQGLYDMCPGEERLLQIPPLLGHGPNSRKLYRIPDNYAYLEWNVRLVTIDSTIQEDNNVVTRDERESRFAYY